MKTKRIDFSPPDGTVPEGTMPGEKFDLVTTYRLNENGTVCLTMMGDSKMPGYDSKDHKAPGYKEYTASMHQGEDQGAAGGGY